MASLKGTPVKFKKKTDEDVFTDGIIFATKGNDLVVIKGDDDLKYYRDPSEVIMQNGMTISKLLGNVKSSGKIVPSTNTSSTSEHRLITPPKIFSINDRFRFLENMVKMVINQTAVSMIITGEGGLGKTYTVRRVLENKGQVEDSDFIMVKGFATARGLYRTLYENSDKLIVFDDCDEVLNNDVAKNLLKGALDSYDTRMINWIVNKESEDLPSKFEFTGQIIFISNKSQENIEQAILSRSMSVDLSMTLFDKIERMKAILPNLKSHVSLQAKEECLALVDKYKEVCFDLNLRTLIKTIDIRMDAENGQDWEDMAIYAMTSTVS